MIRFESNRGKPQVIVFDALDDGETGSDRSCEELNRFLKRDDIEVIGEPKVSYQPPPMFPDEDGKTRSKMYYIVSYREKGKRNAK